MINSKIFSLIIICILFSCKSNERHSEEKSTHYAAHWDSLASYNKAPKWFQEAKFGIYARWGVLSVPAYANDWYPRNIITKHFLPFLFSNS